MSYMPITVLAGVVSADYHEEVDVEVEGDDTISLSLWKEVEGSIDGAFSVSLTPEAAKNLANVLIDTAARIEGLSAQKEVHRSTRAERESFRASLRSKASDG